MNQPALSFSRLIHFSHSFYYFEPGLIKKSLKHPKACPEKRSAFCQKIAEHKENGRSLVFLDESGFAHDRSRTHGYALKGERCFGTHDWGGEGRTNVIGALLGRVFLGTSFGTSLFGTTINTKIFNAWVIQDTLITLSEYFVDLWSKCF